MKKVLAAALLLVGSLCVGAQKSNDAIQKQIKSLHAEKSIYLTYDGNASKLMAYAPNFSDADAKNVGAMAMNFAMATFYPGQTLSTTPESINFTFWPMSKKPRFADSTGPWQVTLPSETLDLGNYRYAAKPSENMEYLNFQIKRTDLAKIATASAPVKFRLGSYNLSFTQDQLQLLRNFLSILDTK
ncbi:MAG: hypothetical protein ACJ73D_05580 [Pyrinomonadaceae bacterium]